MNGRSENIRIFKTEPETCCCRLADAVMCLGRWMRWSVWVQMVAM